MQRLTVFMAEPRGFCAGVVRAIQFVEAALARYGPPVYVRHAIVHNETVVEDLKSKGAVFVENLSQVPTGRPVILSAHGVPRAVIADAENRELLFFDAVCPLVTKVHVEVAQLHARGFAVILIGHAGHQEIDGTLGQLPHGAIHLVGSVAEAKTLVLPEGIQVGYVTQTTLSMFEVQPIVQALQQRFPGIKGPAKNDICYATTNRQEAVMAMVERGAQVIIVVGSSTSSNSIRLVEVAHAAGCPKAFLTLNVRHMPWDEIGTSEIIGITAGASAPESDVEEILTELRARFDVSTQGVRVAEETYVFKLHEALRE